MLPVSATELAAIQTEAASAVCDQACQVWRKSSLVQDSYGTQSNGYTQIVATMAGMSLPSAGELQNFDYEIGDKASWTVRLPYGTNVAEQDHLIVGTQTLEVHILLNPESYPAFTSVIAVEIK